MQTRLNREDITSRQQSEEKRKSIRGITRRMKTAQITEKNPTTGSQDVTSSDEQLPWSSAGNNSVAQVYLIAHLISGYAGVRGSVLCTSRLQSPETTGLHSTRVLPIPPTFLVGLATAPKYFVQWGCNPTSNNPASHLTTQATLGASLAHRGARRRFFVSRTITSRYLAIASVTDNIEPL